LAERSTAHSADRATQDSAEPANGFDSWLARRARLATSDSHSDYELPESGAPPWREEVSDQYADEHEQDDRADRQHEHAYRRPDSLASPEPAYYEPDQTDQYDEHDQADREERREQEPYGPTDADPGHENGYGVHQERYAQPQEDYAPEVYPDDDYAGRNDYHHEQHDLQDPEADEGGRPGRTHTREVDAHPRPANRRRLWLIPVSGLAAVALLVALPFMRGSGRPPDGGPSVWATTTPPAMSEEPAILAARPSPPLPSATLRNPSATAGNPSATPRAAPPAPSSAAPTPTPAVARPAQTRSSGPVQLGPSSNDGVASMVQQYCDRHAGGSAEPRDDGGWQCTRRLLLFSSSSVVDMDVACSDTYGSGAYARTSNSGDPYAWRCYR
jgi:hypothetical protein